MVGSIHAEKLFSSSWWKEKGISLIVYPEGVEESGNYAKK
jgi:hypothetical protein